MPIETITVNSIDFDVVTERKVDVEVSRELYDLLEKEDGEGGYYNSHRSSWEIGTLLDSVEEDGLEEFDDMTEEDVELLKACKSLLDNLKVDVINFVEEY